MRGLVCILAAVGAWTLLYVLVMLVPWWIVLLAVLASVVWAVYDLERS